MHGASGRCTTRARAQGSGSRRSLSTRTGGRPRRGSGRWRASAAGSWRSASRSSPQGAGRRARCASRSPAAPRRPAPRGSPSCPPSRSRATRCPAGPPWRRSAPSPPSLPPRTTGASTASPMPTPEPSSHRRPSQVQSTGASVAARGTGGGWPRRPWRAGWWRARCLPRRAGTACTTTCGCTSSLQEPSLSPLCCTCTFTPSPGRCCRACGARRGRAGRGPWRPVASRSSASRWPLASRSSPTLPRYAVFVFHSLQTSPRLTGGGPGRSVVAFRALSNAAIRVLVPADAVGGRRFPGRCPPRRRFRAPRGRRGGRAAAGGGRLRGVLKGSEVSSPRLLPCTPRAATTSPVLYMAHGSVTIHRARRPPCSTWCRHPPLPHSHYFACQLT